MKAHLERVCVCVCVCVCVYVFVFEGGQEALQRFIVPAPCFQKFANMVWRNDLFMYLFFSSLFFFRRLCLVSSVK